MILHAICILLAPTAIVLCLGLAILVPINLILLTYNLSASGLPRKNAIVDFFVENIVVCMESRNKIVFVSVFNLFCQFNWPVVVRHRIVGNTCL